MGGAGEDHDEAEERMVNEEYKVRKKESRTLKERRKRERERERERNVAGGRKRRRRGEECAGGIVGKS